MSLMSLWHLQIFPTNMNIIIADECMLVTFSCLVSISNFNINICTFQSSSQPFVPFHIVFSLWIKYLSGTVRPCKHILNMSRSKIKDIIFTSSAIIWFITIYISDQKSPSIHLNFFSCLTCWQRQKLLEGKMIWNANVVQRDRAVQETLECVRLSDLGWWREMKIKIHISSFVTKGGGVYPADVLFNSKVSGQKCSWRWEVFTRSLMCRRLELIQFPTCEIQAFCLYSWYLLWLCTLCWLL